MGLQWGCVLLTSFSSLLLLLCILFIIITILLYICESNLQLDAGIRQEPLEDRFTCTAAPGAGSLLPGPAPKALPLGTINAAGYKVSPTFPYDSS